MLISTLEVAVFFGVADVSRIADASNSTRTIPDEQPSDQFAVNCAPRPFDVTLTIVLPELAAAACAEAVNGMADGAAALAAKVAAGCNVVAVAPAMKILMLSHTGVWHTASMRLPSGSLRNAA